MNLEYQVEGTEVVLEYHLEKEEEIDVISLGMLTNNRISGIVELAFSQIDEERTLRYKITGMIPMEKIVNQEHQRFQKRHVLYVLNGVTDALLSAEEYMIDDRAILLDRRYVYVDTKSYKMKMICIPVNNSKLQEITVKEFFQSLLLVLNMDPADEKDYMSKILDYLNAKDAFSAETFQGILREANGGRSQESKRELLFDIAPLEVQKQENMQDASAAGFDLFGEDRAKIVLAKEEEAIQQRNLQRTGMTINTNVLSNKPEPVQNKAQQSGVPIPESKESPKKKSLFSLFGKKKQGSEILENKAKEKRKEGTGSIPGGFNIPGNIIESREPGGENQGEVVLKSPESPKEKKKKEKKVKEKKVKEKKPGKGGRWGSNTDKNTVENMNKFEGISVPQTEAGKKDEAPIPIPLPVDGNQRYDMPLYNGLERSLRTELSNGTDRSVRPDQGNGIDRSVRPDQGDEIDRSIRSDKGNGMDRSVRPDQGNGIDRSVRPDQGNGIDRSVRPDQRNGIDRSVRSDLNNGTDAKASSAAYARLQNTSQIESPKAFITRLGTQERIPITRTVFCIGRSKKNTDYVIEGNETIGRRHVNIIEKDGGYYIMDLNSMNHTFVDGKILQGDERVHLKNGCRIRMSDEEFYFEIVE